MIALVLGWRRGLAADITTPAPCNPAPALKSLQQLHLLLLVAAHHQNQPLLRDVLQAGRWGCGGQGRQFRVGGGVPGGLQVGLWGGRHFHQAVAQLLLRLGEGGERVDAQQQGAGLGVVDVEDFHVHLHVRVEVAAQVAVEQFEAAVGQLVGEEAAGEVDFGVEAFSAARCTSGCRRKFSSCGITSPARTRRCDLMPLRIGVVSGAPPWPKR